MEAQHELAAEIAADCMVLLKNEDAILPLKKGEPVAFIGEFAAKPRFQGGGSSHINSFKTTSALEAAAGLPVTYAPGFRAAEDSITDEQIAEAIAAARAARVAVVFAGLPDVYESEGYDRSHLHIPESQNRLIEAVTAANPNTVVVLHNGAPVEMPWLDRVKGVLEAYLGGQAVGLATVRVLYGEVNPSGRLPETFPKKLSDTPAYLSYGGEGNTAVYNEGIFVGYRYYDKKEAEVLFPFGYGLSYTTFSFSDLRLSAETINDREDLTATLRVKNTGERAGKTVVQLYVSDRESSVFRPVRELKGFEKVSLQPGEEKTVSFKLDRRAFAVWNTQLHDWYVESGEFDIEIGSSSREIVQRAAVTVLSTAELPRHYDLNSIFMDILADPRAAMAFKPLLDGLRRAFLPEDRDSGEAAQEAITEEMNLAMLNDMPLRALASFGGESFDPTMLETLLQTLNETDGNPSRREEP